MPIEAILGTIATVGAICSALFGGGLFKQILAHNAQMAVQKHEIEANKKQTTINSEEISGINIKLALHGKDIDGFAHHVKKLEMLPEINAKLSGIDAALNYLKEQFRDFRAERTEHDKHEYKSK